MVALNNQEMVKTFSTYSGADIVASFNGRIIGELQGITYRVQREVAPVYTMGYADPRSFSRGKRGITGSLVFVQFSRDALLDEMKKDYQNLPKPMLYQSYIANANGQGAGGATGLEDQILNGLKATRSSVPGYGIETWDERMTELGYGKTDNFDSTRLTDFFVPEYVDQLMPFNVTITMANEYGAMAGQEIYGVQLLNEESGYSVDDVVLSKAYTFVARKVKPVTEKENRRSAGRASGNAVVDNKSIGNGYII